VDNSPFHHGFHSPTAASSHASSPAPFALTHSWQRRAQSSGVAAATGSPATVPPSDSVRTLLSEAHAQCRAAEIVRRVPALPADAHAVFAELLSTPLVSPQHSIVAHAAVALNQSLAAEQPNSVMWPAWCICSHYNAATRSPASDEARALCLVVSCIPTRSAVLSVSAVDAVSLRFQFRFQPKLAGSAADSGRALQGDPRRRAHTHFPIVVSALCAFLHSLTLPSPPSDRADLSIRTLPILGADERALLTDSFSGRADLRRSAVPLSVGETLVDVWRRTVDDFGANTAVVCAAQGVRWSYSHVDRQSDALAHWLRQRGVRPGATVGIFTPRCAETLTAIIAVLKAGGAYVPIDPDCPVERAAFVLQHANSTLLLTHSALAAFAPKSNCATHYGLSFSTVPAEASHPFRPWRGELVFLDSAVDSPMSAHAPTVATFATTAVSAAASADDNCYIIYTSGSTGVPKGVAIQHRAACALVAAERSLFRVAPTDVVYHGFSVSFDASVEEIWLAFAAGAALLVATPDMTRSGPDLAQHLTAHGVTVLSTVPTALAMLDSDAPSVRLLILGGEACTRELIVRWAKAGRRRMVNTYGPTEATVIATHGDCDATAAFVTIGRPIPNYTCFIVDPNTGGGGEIAGETHHSNGRQLCPIGVAGELCIGGAGLARGYVGRDDLTRAAFIPNPFHDSSSASSSSSSSASSRLYRTGDLCRWTEDGNIEFLGRIDAQIKLRGFRIELAEIESALSRCASVGSAVCTVMPIAGVDQLVAFIVPARGLALPCTDTSAADFGARNADTPLWSSLVGEWQTQLRRSLPTYMVPSVIAPIADIPTLPSGKAARKLLPPPSLPRAPPISASAAPAAAHSTHELTPLEAHVASAWAQLFMRSDISMDDDFFQLGMLVHPECQCMPCKLEYLSFFIF
jgi:amino acid adenylation domain-containing protein